MAHLLAAPYWPRVAPESRSPVTKTRSRAFDEDRLCGKQRKRKPEKTNGQLLRVRPLHGCNDHNEPSARPV